MVLTLALTLALAQTLTLAQTLAPTLTLTLPFPNPNSNPNPRSVGAALSWPSGLTATVLCTLGGATPEEVVYTGTKGTLRILRPAHAPSRLHLSIAAGRQASEDQTLDFPLPPKPAGALPFNYPGSEGFVYEARAVHAALRAGKTELDEWTHAESVTTQAIVDAMRAAVVSA